MIRRCFPILLILLWAPELVGAALTLNPDKVRELFLSQGLRAQQLRAGIEAKKADLLSVRSRFDTAMTISGDHTIDKSARISSFFGIRTDTTHWNLELDKKLVTGTTLGLHWLNERERSFNANAITGVPNAPTYEPTVEFSFKQSLGENFIGRLDRLEVRETELAVQSLEEESRHAIRKDLAEALRAYWNWTGGLERLRVAEEALRTARDFLRVVSEKKKMGTAEEGDELGARALVSRREAFRMEATAEAELWERTLKSLLSLAEETGLAANVYFAKPRPWSREEAVRFGLGNRLDLAGKKRKLEEKAIRLSVAGQKLIPTIDLDSTLALNEVKRDDYYAAISGTDSPKWNIGLTVTVPLENREARGDRRRARFEKLRQILEVKELEESVILEIGQKRRGVQLAGQAWERRREAAALEGEKLARAVRDYLRGRHSAELILKYQDDTLNAREEALRAKTDWLAAQVDFQEAAGDL